MRGKHYEIRKVKLYERNIPAYAGKTGLPTLTEFTFKEHPRVCGENCLNSNCDTELGGTSPRMRGKPHHQPIGPSEYRNIPAYAGKTCQPDSVRKGKAEHPRVCGENFLILSVRCWI